MNEKQIILNDFITKRPFAAAQTLERLNSEEVALFIQTLPLEKSLRLFSLMNTKKAAECFVFLSSQKTKEFIENGEPDLIASLLKLIEESLHINLLANVSSDKKAIIKRKMEHVPNTVGAFMETAICVNKEMTVDDAVHIVKRNTGKEEFYLYVVDVEGTFEGIVRLKELLLADQTTTLEDLMITTIPKIFPDIQIKSVLNYSAWFEYRHIPVIDKSEKLLGTLPYRTTMKVTQKPSDPSTNEILETSTALGELYRIGLTGLFQSVGK